MNQAPEGSMPHHSESIPCHGMWHYVRYQGRNYNTYVLDIEGFSGPQSLVVLVEADASGRPAVVRGEDLEETVRRLPNDELALAVVQMVLARAAA